MCPEYLSSLYKRLGRYNDAEPLLVRSVITKQRVLGNEHPDTATGFNNLGALYYQWAKAPIDQITEAERQQLYNKAEEFFEQAQIIRSNVLPPDHPHLVATIDNLGGVYREQKKFDKAITMHKKALLLHEAKLGLHHPDVAKDLMNLATTYQVMSEFDLVEPLYVRAAEIFAKAFGENCAEVGQVFSLQSVFYFQKGDLERAAALLKHALSILENALGGDHPLVMSNLANYDVIMQSMGVV
jgi:tetratricopeptide (TPR) repeat protein